MMLPPVLKVAEEDRIFTKMNSASDSGEWSARIGTGSAQEETGSTNHASRGKAFGLIHSVDADGLREKKALTSAGERITWRTRIRNFLCCFAGRHLYFKAACGLESAPVLRPPPWTRPHYVGEGCSFAIGPPAARDEGKVTLVLDLDETLLHSSFSPVPNADWVVPVDMEGETLYVYVIKRPWLDYFMEQVGNAFEVVVFTASLSKYADPVLDLLDTGKHVRWRLYRDSCCPYGGNFVKDMQCLGRDLSRTILVDNSPHSYLFQPENALPIATFIDNPEDRGLLDLLPLLLKLESRGDVRVKLKKLQGHLH